jgi:hypothetical protein
MTSLIIACRGERVDKAFSVGIDMVGEGSVEVEDREFHRLGSKS